MIVETISHSSGNQFPILLDANGLPIPAPNEFIFSRMNLSTNTLKRNLNELAVLYKWFKEMGVDPIQRISEAIPYKEAEICGSLAIFLRREFSKKTKVRKIVVAPSTFKQRLTTVRKFFSWLYEVHLSLMPHSDSNYEKIRDQKHRLIAWIDASFIQSPPSNNDKAKGLEPDQADFLIKIINPNSPEQVFGRDPAVRFRNYVSIMIMLTLGLRPGELLSLRVEDVEFGGISGLRVVRRVDDPKDKRKPRPRIKRQGRVLVIENKKLLRSLNDYIMNWRGILGDKSSVDTDYLILSDEGDPLSLPSVSQFFRLIRNRFPDELPGNLTAKSLRHTFSRNIEKSLREQGMDEEQRAKNLAYMRGDTSLSSQDVYLMQEIEEQSKLALSNYHKKLLN